MTCPPGLVQILVLTLRIDIGVLADPPCGLLRIVEGRQTLERPHAAEASKPVTLLRQAAPVPVELGAIEGLHPFRRGEGPSTRLERAVPSVEQLSRRTIAD